MVLADTAKFIPSHDIAMWILDVLDSVTRGLGLKLSPEMREVVYAIVVVGVALLIGWIFRWIIVWITHKFLANRQSELAQTIVAEHIMIKCTRIVPPLVILAMLPWAFLPGSKLLITCEKILWAYTIVVIALAINALLTLIWTRYNNRENTKNLPLKGILNTAQGIVWIIAVISIVSMLLDKSPVVLLTGLGAFAAALMLIFKDSILGFVAGIQLSQNDMIRVGDWITVPGTPANGIVEDMSLTTVKVRNYDNTLITLPPYTLVSTSFQNWRSMQQSGARRIFRNLIVDCQSVAPIDDQQIADIVKNRPLLAPFVAKSKPGTPVYNPAIAGMNGTIDTNLGLFRAYVCAYILSRPEFNHDNYMMVRWLDPIPQGIPLQIYCFTATTKWVEYEAIQSALFEHLVAVAPEFKLQVFNAPSGADVDQVEVALKNKI